MKKLLSCLLGLALVASAAFAGVGYSGKEIKQVAPPPCPEWYADREFNISLWGTYVFTGNNWIDDRYIEADHAWGGGVDLKYFFMRYVGVGIEGWAVDARQPPRYFCRFKRRSLREQHSAPEQRDWRGTWDSHPTLSDFLHAYCAIHFWRSWWNLCRGQKQVNQRFVEPGGRFRCRRANGSYRRREHAGWRRHGNPVTLHRLGQ